MIFLRLLLVAGCWQAALSSRKDDSDGNNHMTDQIVNHIADGIANQIADEMLSGKLQNPESSGNPKNPERKEVAVQKLLEADIAIGHDFHLNCDQKDLQGAFLSHFHSL